jgi:hypothetical protein
MNEEFCSPTARTSKRKVSCLLLCFIFFAPNSPCSELSEEENQIVGGACET